MPCGPTELRSVEESEFTCDEAFDHLIAAFGRNYIDGFQAALPEHQADMGKEKDYHPFVKIGDDDNSVTSLLLRDVPFPWPFTPRFIFVVQDYVREKGRM